MEEKKQNKVDVLVVGGGPGGLTMAYELHRYGIGVRVIDKHTSEELSKMLHHTRAISYFTPTADVFQTMGVWPEMVARLFPVNYITVYYRGVQAEHVMINVPPTDLPQQFFPTRTRTLGYSHSQNEICGIIEKKLEDVNIKLEQGVELIDFKENDTGAEATLQSRSGEKEVIQVAFIIAADGFHSPIREKLGIRYEGWTYDSDYGLVDCKRPVWQHSQERANSYCFYIDSNGVILGDNPFQDGRTRMMHIKCPIKREPQNKDDIPAGVCAGYKKIGCVPAESFEKLEEIGTPSITRVHNKHAQRWKSAKGRVFLLGDAAHCNSPAFGQGMNMAIQDAHNLAWKLSMVLQNKAKATILDTFQPERIRMWKHASITSKMVEDSFWMARHWFTRNMMKYGTKWRRARSIFAQVGTGYKAPYIGTPLTQSHNAPRGAIPAGIKVYLSNPEPKPLLNFTVYVPTSLAALHFDATAPLQKASYQPPEHNLAQQNFVSFLQQQWAATPAAFHSLYIFDVNGKTNEFAKAAAAKLKSFAHVYNVVPSPSSSPSATSLKSSSSTPSTANGNQKALLESNGGEQKAVGSEADQKPAAEITIDIPQPDASAASENGYAIVVDGALALHHLFGMLRGGMVLVRPDQYVAYVSGDLNVKQLSNDRSSFNRYLHNFYTF